MLLLNWFIGIWLYLWHNPILLTCLGLLGCWALIISLMGFQRPLWIWNLIFPMPDLDKIIKEINEDRRS